MRNNRGVVAVLVCLPLTYTFAPVQAQTLTAANRSTGRSAEAAASGKAGPAARDAKPAESKSSEAAKEPAKNEKETQLEILASLEELRKVVADQSRKMEEQQAALRQQEERVKDLERQLAARDANSAGGPAASAAPAPAQTSDGLKQVSDRIEKVENDFGAYKKANDGKVGRFGPFAFSGDARFRFEPFVGGGTQVSNTPARNRYRIRLRFNANAKFNDQFSGGFSLGSGDTNDPISTNQTLTNGFTRKPFFIDKAFVKYDPIWAKPFSVTVGKFGYTWYRTELTWDNDLNVEGFSETLGWSFKDSPLQRLALVAFQSPVMEISGGKDTWVYGGQLQTIWKLGELAKFSGYVGYYNYQNADPLRAARQAGTVGGSSSTNAAAVGGQQYESKFGILDTIARLDWKTPWSRWPIMTQFDFAQNTRACANLVNIPLANQTLCNSKDRQAYYAEFRVGRSQEQGDWNFGYTFFRIEREAVIDAFNFSDLRQPTSVFNHRLDITYQAYRNIQVGVTGLFGKPLQTAIPSQGAQIFLKRMQFDVMYKF